jgi:hypothetical protein
MSERRRTAALGVIALSLAIACGIWYSYSVILVALLAEFGCSGIKKATPRAQKTLASLLNRGEEKNLFLYFFSKPRIRPARAVAACIRSEKSEPLRMSCTPMPTCRSRSSGVYMPPMPGNLPCLRQAAMTLA